jgi:hypothetical protein
MHPQIIGRPSRITLLEELIQYILGHPRVWLARCDEVATRCGRPCARRLARQAAEARPGSSAGQIIHRPPSIRIDCPVM